MIFTCSSLYPGYLLAMLAQVVVTHAELEAATAAHQATLAKPGEPWRPGGKAENERLGVAALRHDYACADLQSCPRFNGWTREGFAEKELRERLGLKFWEPTP